MITEGGVTVKWILAPYLLLKGRKTLILPILKSCQSFVWFSYFIYICDFFGGFENSVFLLFTLSELFSTSPEKEKQRKFQWLSSFVVVVQKLALKEIDIKHKDFSVSPCLVYVSG